ncbi:hypothetical protein FFT09_14550 [Saccharomonospora piscinae]|uniref:hypothetical protein n=1 Tax=Saccharomonospora piscinae TaxID=687388 RepID=UPI001105D5BB|nr:hypothetical protein [Saccharomonospora piscinae]TLW92098.1 hypothetical protein FFT09_14550 [Saccharomonospora piscinae]
MWRLGFRFWRLGLACKYGLPAVGVLALIYHAQGASELFVTVLCLVLLAAGAGVLVLREFGAREFGSRETGHRGRRTRS